MIASLSKLEDEVKVKDDLNQMNEAKKNSLELDGIAKQVKIEKFQRICMNKTLEITKLKEDNSGGNSSEHKVKVKKLQEELKDKTKKVDDGEKRVDDLMKKFSNETMLEPRLKLK